VAHRIAGSKLAEVLSSYHKNPGGFEETARKKTQMMKK
jgi:hypothetical protein